MSSAIARHAIAAAVAFVLLVGAMLLVRPLIFSLAPPRGDDQYVIATTDEVAAGPITRDILLNEPHGLLGERPNGLHAAISVVISRTPTGGYAVVDAWSPVSSCAVTLATDRLVDCNRHAWTLEGDPFDRADPPLQRFALVVTSGALVANLTHPIDAGP